MIVLTVIVAVWLLLTVLILAACRAARLGDQTQQCQQEPLRSVTPEPASAEVTVRRRRRSRTVAAILPAGLRSSQDLFTR